VEIEMSGVLALVCLFFGRGFDRGLLGDPIAFVENLGTN